VEEGRSFNLFICIKTCPADFSSFSNRSLDRGYRPFDSHLQYPEVTEHCRLQWNYLHCDCKHVIRTQTLIMSPPLLKILGASESNGIIVFSLFFYEINWSLNYVVVVVVYKYHTVLPHVSVSLECTTRNMAAKVGYHVVLKLMGGSPGKTA
jgi:hypothetical protein